MKKPVQYGLIVALALIVAGVETNGPWATASFWLGFAAALGLTLANGLLKPAAAEPKRDGPLPVKERVPHFLASLGSAAAILICVLIALLVVAFLACAYAVSLFR